MATLSEPTRSSGARPVFWQAGRARLLGTTALAGLLTAVLVAPVRADSSWTGAVSSDWFNAGNWSNGVPAANDTVLIQNNNLPNGAVAGATGATAGGVLIGDSASGSLTIQNGGSLNVSVLTGLGTHPGGSGLVVVTGAGSTLTSRGGLEVGSFGPGTLVVANGGTVISGGTLPTPFGGAAALGALGSTGTAIVDGTGSLWQSLEIAIGQFGTGVLTVSNGGTVAGLLNIAQAASSTGTLNIGAASGVGATAPGVVSGPSVQFGDGTGTIVFNHSSNNYVFAPVISGAGSIQIENGTTIFTGTNTYTGGTTMTNNHVLLQLGNGGTTGSITGDVTNNGTLAFNRSNTYQFDGVISGAGAVEQDGTGTTTLTATNTYSGGTTFTAGTVSVSFDANLGNATGGLTFNGGTLQVTGTTFNSTARTITWGAGGGGFDIDDAANNFTVSQALAGGPLTKSGAGTLTLSGANTYTGATTITGGTLALSGNGSIATSSGVADNGTFDISAASTGVSIQTLSGTGTVTLGANTLTLSNASSTYSGAIGGSGGLTLTTGTETLSGTLSYQGNTTVNGGTLHVTNAFTVLSTATLTVNNTGTYTIDQLLTNSGAIQVNAGGTLTATAGGITNNFAATILNNGRIDDTLHNAGTVTNNLTYNADVATNTGTITNANIWNGDVLFNAGSIVNAASATWTGNISTGGTFTNAGIVTGTLTNTAGTTTNNGSISGAVTVSGGTFKGTGSSGGLTIGSGAVFAPGNGTPGTSATVNGSLAFSSGAFYQVAINPTTASFVSATGTATLGGASVQAFFSSGTYVAKQYTILSAGSVSGTFNGPVNSNLPSGFKAALSYDRTHAYLDLSLVFIPPPGTGLNANQQKVGNAIINFFNANGSIPLVFGGLWARPRPDRSRPPSTR